MTQRCGRCKQEKPIDDFSPSYRGKVGTWCRPCFAAYNRGEPVGTTHQPRECDFCGREYVPKQLRPDAAFCSQKCKGEARYARTKARVEMDKGQRGCTVCGADIPPTRRSDAVCCSDACVQRAKYDPAARWARCLARYGITQSDWDALLASQDGRCAVCRTDEPGKRGWAVDHCHTTNVVRGILCGRCNMALGLLRDDPAIARSAAAYLERSTL